MKKKDKLGLYFNKSFLRSSKICACFGWICALLFIIKFILAEYRPEISFGQEDVIGLSAGLFLFSIFFPITVFLSFTNNIGKEFFMKNDKEK